MRCPADEARRSEFSQIIVVGRARLRGVGSDDFEIVFFTEGKKSIARATSRMDAAECGSDAGMFLDESDAFVEITRAKKNVIEHSGHLNGSPGNGRRGECASGHSEK